MPGAAATGTVLVAPAAALALTWPDRAAMRWAFVLACAGAGAVAILEGRAWQRVLLAGPRSAGVDRLVHVTRGGVVAGLALLAVARVVPTGAAWGDGVRAALLALGYCLPVVFLDVARARRRLPDRAGLPALAEVARPAHLLVVGSPRPAHASSPAEPAPVLVQRGATVRLADPSAPGVRAGDPAAAWRASRRLPVVDGAWPARALDLGRLGGVAAVMVGGVVVGVVMHPRARLSPALRLRAFDAPSPHHDPAPPIRGARPRSRP